MGILRRPLDPGLRGRLRLRRPPGRGLRLRQQDPLAPVRPAARVHRPRRHGPGDLQRLPDDGTSDPQPVTYVGAERINTRQPGDMHKRTYWRDLSSN